MDALRIISLTLIPGIHYIVRLDWTCLFGSTIDMGGGNEDEEKDVNFIKEQFIVFTLFYIIYIAKF